MLDVRKKNHWWCQSVQELTDVFRSTLAITGHKGTGTGPHKDWMEAENLLLYVKGGDFDVAKPGARWLIVPPKHADTFDALLRAHFPSIFPYGLATISVDGQSPLLTEEMMDLLQGENEELVSIEQFAGDMVWVLPGVIHAVINLQDDTLKVAYDRYDPTHFHLYAASQKALGGLFKDKNIKDYSAWMDIVISYCASKTAQVELKLPEYKGSTE